MRSLNIISIVTNPAVANEPQYIVVSGNQTNTFHGDMWLDQAGTITPGYTYNLTSNLPPYGTTLIPATTFRISNNSDYGGNYRVYSKTSASDFDPAVFDSVSNTTKIHVQLITSTGSNTTTGKIDGISTYLFDIPGTSNKIPVYETTFNTQASPIPLIGRYADVWGEVIQQSLINLLSNFASATAPVNPPSGMAWFDSQNKQLKIYDGTSWITVSNTTKLYTHNQTSASNTWTVQHAFNLTTPFIADVSVYVNTPNGIKTIIPNDITFTSKDQLVISFTTPYTGIAVIK